MLGSLTRMRRRFLVSTAFVDGLLLVVASAAGLFAAFETIQLSEISAQIGGQSVVPMLLALAAGWLTGSLAVILGWSGTVPRPSFGRALSVVGIGVMTSSLLLTLFRPYFSRTVLAVAFSGWLAGALAQRLVRLRLTPWRERAIVVSSEKSLIEDLHAAPNLEIVEAIDPQGQQPDTAPDPDATLAIDLRTVLSDSVASYLSSSSLAGLEVKSLVDVYEAHTGRIPLVRLAEGWELSGPLSRSLGFERLKRVFDVAFSIVTSPLWLVTVTGLAAAVRLSSPGAAIYRQVRVGKDGRSFVLYKLRTMVTEADDSGHKFADPDDGRITPIGAWLRRTRLDELPQMWNVVRGDLSLVGPRPEQVPFVDEFRREIPFYDQRHLIRPGLTGWAQINQGYTGAEGGTIEKLTYDLYYVKHMSPSLDTRILLSTLWTMLSGFGSR